MQVQAYLMLDRLDFAKKCLKQMQDIDDDSVLTQVAQAWCNIVIGGEKSKDAYFAFQELADKSKSTPLLLNGQVCAFLAQGMMVEAEAALNEAMDIDSNNYDTLVNQVVYNQVWSPTHFSFFLALAMALLRSASASTIIPWAKGAHTSS